MRLRLLTERLTARLITTVSIGVMLLTLVVAAALAQRSLPLLRRNSVARLLLGAEWHPMDGEFGFRPFLAGTLWVTLLAMCLAVPVCLLSACYLAEYARPATRAIIRPLLDVLAGIPSVVYGLFGVLLLVPLVSDHFAPWAARHLSFLPGMTPTEGYATGYCLLTGALVLAMMVSPLIIAIADEILRGLPEAMREASLSLGATRWETIKHVSLRFSAPGLVASVVLGFARAFGETMAVLMVVGNVPLSPRSIFDPAYPLPALIANNYGEMMSIPTYDSALLFAALVLMITVLGFNLLAQAVLVAARRRTAQ